MTGPVLARRELAGPGIPEPSRRLTAILLVVIVATSWGLRSTNLDWDRGAHLHPDERFLTLVNEEISAPGGPSEYFDTDRSPLNPANHGDWYVYGTAPLFLTKAVGSWLHDGAVNGGQPAGASLWALERVGIDLLDDEGAPSFDAGYHSERIGRLLSALIDTLTTLMVFELGRLAAGRRAGLAAALVWATAVLAIQHAHFFVVEPMLVSASAATLLAAAHVLRGRGRLVLAAGAVAVGVAGASKLNGLLVASALLGAVAWRHLPQRRWRDAATDAAIVGVVALATFRVLQPYAFDGPLSPDRGWLDAMGELARLQDGGDSPVNVQWADRLPVVEPLWNLVRFGFGIPASALVVVAVVALVRSLRSPARAGEPVVVLLAGWALLCGLVVLPRWVSTMRYMLPAYPALAALAGVGAARLMCERSRLRWLGPVLLGGCVLWAGAFTNGVYLHEHPRLAAAEWMLANAPPGSVVSNDEWDDGLPFSQVGADPGHFESVLFTPFDTDDPDDVRELASQLDRVDFVVQTSDRVTGSVPRVPARFGPVLRYQRALEDGSLGFARVARFTTGPSLFGIDFDDGSAEEAFRVYDHPTVRIWAKTPGFSVQGALEVLRPERAGVSLQVPLDRAASNGLMLREQDGATEPAGEAATFAEVFDGRLPLAPLWWLAWWELTAFAALGWSARLFRALPDRGVGLAKVVGPMAVVVILWSLVAWGLVPFSRLTAASVTLGVLAVGWGVPRLRREALGVLAAHRRTVVTVEVIALVVFGAVLALRAAVPDLWFHPSGGEKPFEAAFFTSVARTSTLPPADPWFSSGAMNYYYGSWFAAAVPTRILGILPEVALNLAIATTASLVAAASYSVGRALGALGLRMPRGRKLGALAGLMAAGSLLLLGNLDTARQVVAGEGSFSWWSVSRLNPGTTDINEFPAWSVLFGDAHPHLLSLPVVVATVGVLVAYVVRPRLAVAWVAGVCLAWVRISHTWDLPVLAAASVGAVVLAAALEPGDVRRRCMRALGHLCAIGSAAVLLAHPYVRATEVFDGGFTIAATTTPVGSFVLQYGIPLAILVLFLAREASREWRTGRIPAALRSPRGATGAAVCALGVVVLLSSLRGPVVAIAVLVVSAALCSAVPDLRSGRSGRGIATLLAASGVSLAALPDVLVVLNDIGRQNTVFKFGYTAWVLLALGSAALAAELVVPGGGHRLGHVARWRLAVAAVVAPGLLFWPVAAPARVGERFAAIGPTLDGRAWLDHGPVQVAANGVPRIDVTADEPLVEWLRSHARNGQTLVEAAGPPYSWAGRISVATGLPTVIGWSSHELQQRRGHADSVEARVADVGDLYRVADAERAQRILATYRPDYVVVGTVERALGEPSALEGLGHLRGLEAVHISGEGVVYGVDLEVIDADLARLDAARIGGEAVSAPR